MKKATHVQLLLCFLLVGVVVFNSLNYRPRCDAKEKASVISENTKGSFTWVCDFSIEEKDGKSRLGQKNPHTQFLICLFEEFSFNLCDKVKFPFAYHIPEFLKDTSVVPLYLRCRSLLI
jgi:hypothetical protein